MISRIETVFKIFTTSPIFSAGAVPYTGKPASSHVTFWPKNTSFSIVGMCRSEPLRKDLKVRVGSFDASPVC